MTTQEIRSPWNACCHRHTCAATIDTLRSRVEALTTENAALLSANRDAHLHFDALKADFDRLTAEPDAALAGAAKALREAYDATRAIGRPVGASDGCGTRVVGSSVDAERVVQAMIDRLEREGK